MDPVASILAYMDAHPGTSARKAADALGLAPADAREARKRRNASRARANKPAASVVQLAPPPIAASPTTDDPVAFWEGELLELARRREGCASDGSWVAYSQLTRTLHTARERYDQSRAAAPPVRAADTDSELLEALAEELAELPEHLRRQVTG